MNLAKITIFVIFLFNVIAFSSCDHRREDRHSDRSAESHPERRSRPVADRSKPIRSDDSVERLQAKAASLSMTQLKDLVSAASADRAGESALRFEVSIMELAKRDPAGALAFFSHPHSMDSLAGFSTVCEVISDSDPLLLRSWARENLGHFPELTKSLGASFLLSYLAKTQPESALSLFMELDLDRSEKAAVIPSLGQGLARHDPIAAAAAVKNALDGALLDEALHSISKIAAIENADLGLEIAKGISNEGHRFIVTSDLFAKWMSDDPQEAVRRLALMDIREVQAILRHDPNHHQSLVATMARESPDALIGFLGQITPSEATKSIYGKSVALLMNSHPAEIMEIVNSVPAGPLRSDLQMNLFIEKAKEDPAAAVAGALHLPIAEERTRSLHGIAGETARSGTLDDVTRLAKMLPDDGQSSFIRSAMSHLIDRDAKELADRMLHDQGSLLLDESDREAVLPDLSRRVFEMDSGYAREWMSGLPPKDRPAAMRGAAAAMVRSDVVSLSEMLTDLPRDDTWAAGAKVLIDSLNRSDPEAAERWLDALHRSGYR